MTKPDEPVLYYLLDRPTRGLVREEQLVVPPDTQLPPDGVLPRALKSSTCRDCIFVASVSTSFSAIQTFESKGESNTVFKRCP